MATPGSAVIPAQLGFLAIYNPSLGTTDDKVEDQIVYFASIRGNKSGRSPRRRSSRDGGALERVSQEERNERLRQIGLAQGMVAFGRSFSGQQPVDTVETEKSRVILQEVEPGWWILASIDLTRLRAPGTSAVEGAVEYSSREVKPAILLHQELLRAHSIFLLHHCSSLSALFVRSKRAKFVDTLSRYWELFLSTWNVMLHGNPIRDVMAGIKLAACGELGVGVGEEYRGSGEREVLEGLVDRVEGLVDLVVGKYGGGGPDSHATTGGVPSADGRWLGSGKEPGAEDGGIFLGVGALSRHSVRDIMFWMDDLYTWGQDAYGVKHSPNDTRSRRKKKPTSKQDGGLGSVEAASGQTGKPATASAAEPSVPATEDADTDTGGMDRFLSYLKRSIGSSPSGGSSDDGNPKATGTKSDTKSTKAVLPGTANQSEGHFLVGLIGNLEDLTTTEVKGDEYHDPDSPRHTEEPETNSRIMVRTLTVELESKSEHRSESQTTRDFGSQDNELTEETLDNDGNATEDATSRFDSQDRNKTSKVRVVVYVNKPFIFIFLFQLFTDSLAWDGLYHSLHRQLTPLRRSMPSSTAFRPDRPDGGSSDDVIFDLLWDPHTLTIHSTIPNIPDPVPVAPPSWVPPQSATAWSRLEALNTHTQLLNMFGSMRGNTGEVQRTVKTSRGWWIVWSRIIDCEAQGENSDAAEEWVVGKEIFLVRKARDHGGSVRGVSPSITTGGSQSVGWANGASRLAQGIGMDTKKYMDGLLRLN